MRYGPAGPVLAVQEIMAKKMLFNATEAEESRVAVLNDGFLDEYYIERSSQGLCLGNIYLARVTNIEPSIDAAFIEFGGPRHGFLHASDVAKSIKREKKNGESRAKPRKRGEVDAGKSGGKAKDSPIAELLSAGQTVVVQVTKEGIGDKAPTLTTFISLPGRFLVFMPGTTKRGISRKIDDEEERERLKRLMADLEAPEDMGLIIRTAGLQQTKRELQKDVRYLNNLWKVIQKRVHSQQAPATLYQENDLVIRALRDLYTSDIKDVLVDSEEVFKRVKDFMKIVMPRQVDRVKLYKGSRPLFDHYNIEKELEKIFNKRISLKSGGSIIIEQTEALVAIDVNSGKFKGGELEETAFKINQEAAKEIARQLRLRDMGGLIINDFIDMKVDRHRREVERAFRDALKSDRARIKMTRISPFGIIEMTRQRVRPSLKRSLFDRCDHCGGTGYIASLETTCLNIIRKIRLWVTQRKPILRIQVNSRTADYMNNYKRSLILELEHSYNKKILISGWPDIPEGEIRLTAEDNERSKPYRKR